MPLNDNYHKTIRGKAIHSLCPAQRWLQMDHHASYKQDMGMCWYVPVDIKTGTSENKSWWQAIRITEGSGFGHRLFSSDSRPVVPNRCAAKREDTRIFFLVQRKDQNSLSKVDHKK
jgi:hypothetical protein